MGSCCGLRSKTLMQQLPALSNYRPRSFSLAIEIRPMETVARAIGKFGYETPTATRSCWLVPMDRPMETGSRELRSGLERNSLFRQLNICRALAEVGRGSSV